VEVELLEHCLREDLNRRAPRFMGVLDPVRIVLTNWPEGKVEELDAVNNPEDASKGTRKVPFSRELFIDRDDFREIPPPKYHRLSPGQEVRLRWGYIIRCQEVVRDEAGSITELRCTVDPATRGGDAPGRKVKGTIHWVSAGHALPAEVRLYDRLFVVPNPDDAPEGRDFLANLNPESLVVKTACRVEPSLAALTKGDVFQFERVGYFTADPDGAPGRLVFNRSVSLRDTWGKIEKKARGNA
jgi:glutaminyl-tRNA synthetase